MTKINKHFMSINNLSFSETMWDEFLIVSVDVSEERSNEFMFISAMLLMDLKFIPMIY